MCTDPSRQALACVSQCFTHRAVINGIGQTIGRVAVTDAMQASLDMILAVCTGQISLIIGKWSAALLIFQIQGRTMARAKWILYVTLTLNALTGVTASIFMWLSCERIPDQWQTNVVSNPSCTRFWIGTKVLCTCWGESVTLCEHSTSGSGILTKVQQCPPSRTSPSPYTQPLYSSP